MKDKPVRSPLPRGRIAQWSRERIAALSTIELRVLFDHRLRGIRRRDVEHQDSTTTHFRQRVFPFL